VLDVVLDGDRQDPLVDEGADGVLDQPLLVAELELHAPSLCAGAETADHLRRKAVRID
jgi:hypothetical protein